MTFIELAPIRLAPPAYGDPALAHDATFSSWDRSLSAMRDVVNLGIGALNQAGAGLPELPGGSLEDYLVLPLSGDYGAIRQNAEACHQVHDALATWAGNLARLSIGFDPGWDGQAAASFFVRLNAYGLLARGLGEIVGRGSAVFDEIARISEQIGIEVERLIVAFGKALARLVRRLLEKVAGPVGWAAFALELVTHGLDAVTDIVDDVRLVLSIVDTLRDLRETVSDWAAQQHDNLGMFAELSALLAS